MTILQQWTPLALMPVLIQVNNTVIDETLKEEPSELITTDLFGKSEITIDPLDIPEISIEFDWQNVKKEQEENYIDHFDNTDNFETEDNSNLPGENEQVGSDHENTWQEHIAQVHEGFKHESKRNQHLKCSSCGYRSETRYGMNKHITQQHKDQNVKTINTAPRKAKIPRKENQKLLDDNILDLSKNSNSENLALETDEMFFGRTEVSEDQNANSFHTVNEGIKPFICKICNSRFVQKAHLIRHTSSNHEEKKPFQSNTCDSSFTRKAILNEHIKSIHEGVKSKKVYKEGRKTLHNCSLCDKKCQTALKLMKHVTIIHESKNLLT